MPTSIAVPQVLLAVALVLAASAHAQDAADVAMPDAPLAADDSGGQSTPSVAGKHERYIEPGVAAPRLTAGDKVVLGVRSAFTPAAIAVWPLVAGYEQVRNSSPNFPQTTRGYLRRLGSAAARDSAEEMFATSVFAPVLRQDPRYYRVGPKRSFGYRLIYSVTRPIITRTDAGRSAPNASYVLGVAFSSWLTDAYYPTLNQGFDQNAKTFGGSMGASALGCAVAEFAADVLETLHLLHRQ